MVFVILKEMLVKKVCLEQGFEFIMSFVFLMCSGRSFQYFAAAQLKPLSANYFFLLNGMSRVMPDDVDCLVVLRKCFCFNSSLRNWKAFLESIVDYC